MKRYIEEIDINRIYDLSLEEKNESILLYMSILCGERKRFPNNYWNENLDNLKHILKWLFDKYLEVSINKIPLILTQPFIRKFKLFGVFNSMFGGSTYELINFVYPNTFMAWEMSKMPNNFWNNETEKKATKWLIEEKLKINTYIKSEIFINKADFIENGLTFVFNKSYKRILNEVYPNNKFKRAVS